MQQNRFSLDTTIYHITLPELWEEQKKSRFFAAPSLDSENFIHCCTAEQLVGVLERYFVGTPKITLLEIDTSLLSPKCVFEAAPPTHLKFPHIYGAINKTAIIKILTKNL